MHILQSKKVRYTVALIVSTIVITGMSFATFSDTYKNLCSGGKVGCASEKTFGWPMPFTSTTVNGTVPPQYQVETSSVDPVGTVANIVIILIMALGIERALRLTLKK